MTPNGDRIFPVEASPDGCASGECLPTLTPEEFAQTQSKPEVQAPGPRVEAPKPEAVQVQVQAPAPRPPASSTSPIARAVPVSASGASPASAFPDEPAASKDDPGKPLLERWRAAVDTVRSVSARHATSLSNGFLLWIRPGHVAITFKKEAGFHRTQTVSQSSKPVLEKALSAHFGCPTRLSVEDNQPVTGPTLAELDQAQKDAREKSTDDAVRTHPAIRAALKILGGNLEHVMHLEPAPPATPDAEPVEEPT